MAKKVGNKFAQCFYNDLENFITQGFKSEIVLKKDDVKSLIPTFAVLFTEGLLSFKGSQRYNSVLYDQLQKTTSICTSELNRNNSFYSGFV